MSKKMIFYKGYLALNQLGIVVDTTIYAMICDGVLIFSALLFIFLNDLFNRKLQLQLAMLVEIGMLVFFAISSMFPSWFVEDLSNIILLCCIFVYLLLFGGIVFPLSLCFFQEYLPFTMRFTCTHLFALFFMILYACQDYLTDLISSYLTSFGIYVLSIGYCMVYLVVLCFVKDTSRVELQDILDL